jgi:hypothetical protein
VFFASVIVYLKRSKVRAKTGIQILRLPAR